MYRAIGTAAVGSRHPPAQCLSHTTRIISNAYSLTAAPLYHYYFQLVLSASQSAVGRQSSCRGVFNSFFPSFLTRRRALVLLCSPAWSLPPSFLVRPSARQSVAAGKMGQFNSPLPWSPLRRRRGCCRSGRGTDLLQRHTMKVLCCKQHFIQRRNIVLKASYSSS